MENTTKTAEIKTWFPKSVFSVTNFLSSKELECLIKQTETQLALGTQKTTMLQVNSTHETNNFSKLTEFSFFKEKILEAVNAFAEALGYTEQQRKTMKFINMWANESHEGDFNFPHVHSGSQFSGAFYLMAPTDAKITFFNDITNTLVEPINYNELSYNWVKYDCIPNSLLLFKSDFLHGNEYQPPGRKIVISFNISMEIK
jgi:uncharacterized protein (TIGR02466 family)